MQRDHIVDHRVFRNIVVNTFQRGVNARRVDRGRQQAIVRCSGPSVAPRAQSADAALAASVAAYEPALAANITASKS